MLNVMRQIIPYLILITLLATTACAQNPLTLVGQYDGEAAWNFFGMFTTMGDFDGDGMDEFVINAYGWNDYAGKNYIYQYDQDWPQVPFLTVHGEQTGVAYGMWAANLGDISNDGLTDLGLPNSSNINSRLDVFFGSNPMDTLPDWTLYPAGPTQSYAGLLDSCGDVNGDGGADFLMLATYYTDNYTAVEIHHGGEVLDSIPDWVLAPVNLRPEGLGDVNADGYNDVMMLSSSAPAKLYFGGSPMDTIPDLLFYDNVWNAIGGGVGDVNGDGYADFCLNMRFPDSTLSYDAVYFGGSSVDNIPDLILQNRYGEPWGSLRGICHGDFNGDGYDDIVSATGDLTLGNTVYLYLGSPWFNPFPDAYVTIYSTIFEFGYTVSTGDVNGDGSDELLVTAKNYNLFYRGRVYLYTGPEEWVDYGAGIEPGDVLRHPGWFVLEQNYPNPFNTTTSIHFELGKPSMVNLRIYDLQGNKIKDLITSQQMLPGGYNVSWTGRNQQNQLVSSGIYLLELQVDQYRQIRKMVLLR